MISTAIITAPRKRENYIGNSLSSYFDYWTIQPHVFCEPGVSAYLNRSKVIEHHNETTLGCVLNWYGAATWMLNNTDTPFVMMLEDDILWLEDARDKLVKLLDILSGKVENRQVSIMLPLNSIGFVSCYCSTVNNPKSRGWQEATYRLSGWCGALCLVFPRESLELLLSDKDRFLKASESSDTARVTRIHSGPVHLDYAIGKILKDEGKKLLTHSPSLIQHMGDDSTFESNNKPHNRNSPFRQPSL